MPKKAKTKIDIEVMPYLSIMVCVLNIICLITVVMVMNIAMNPMAIAIVSFKGLFTGTVKGPAGGSGTGAVAVEGKEAVLKVPSYMDCSPGGISLFPGEVNVLPAELSIPGNAVEKMLDKIEANTAKEYVIVLIRPGSLPVYRAVRKMIANRNIDIAYDTLEMSAKIDWREEAKALNITLPK